MQPSNEQQPERIPEMNILERLDALTALERKIMADMETAKSIKECEELRAKSREVSAQIKKIIDSL
jgi:hypothetical protein